MRTEIYIEDQRLDLTQDISAELTYSIDEIQDFGTRNTSFSKTIILPGNANNNKIFGHVFDFNRSTPYDPEEQNYGYNFNPAATARCVILIDKIQVFKGVLRLLEIVIDNQLIEYECAVFGELGGFVSALGNNRLENLDFSSYDIAWNFTNIQNSWNNVTGGGIYFPLIDYGSLSGNKVDFDFKAFRPAFYVREILNKIITASGYTWDFPLLSTALFDRLVIPNNQLTLFTSSTKVFQSAFTTGTYTSGSNLPMTVSTAGLFTGTSPITYTGTEPLNINITASITLYLNSLSSNPNNTVLFRVIKNSTIIKEEVRILTEFPQQYANVDLSVSGISVVQSDVLYFVIVQNIVSYEILGGGVRLDNSVSVDVPTGYNETILMNGCLPKGIFQRDFFSSIVKMFNLYVVEDKFVDKKLVIKPFIDFYSYTASAQYDWSNKMDRAKPIRLKPMSELNARFYHFAYKPDSDYYGDNYRKKYNEGYGDLIEDTQIEYVKETEKVEVIFAATPLYQYLGTDKIYSAIYKLSNTKQSEDPMDSVIRILQAQKITNRVSWAMKNGGTTLATYNDYGYAGHLFFDSASFTATNLNPTSDINFGAPAEIYFRVQQYTSANLFNSYWSEYIAEITDKDSKLLTAQIKLNDVDIYNLDFGKLLYIDGSLWRLNRILDYNPIALQTTKCEFLKVIELI
jgi:hypothetical protein